MMEQKKEKKKDYLDLKCQFFLKTFSKLYGGIIEK